MSVVAVDDTTALLLGIATDVLACEKLPALALTDEKPAGVLACDEPPALTLA